MRSGLVVVISRNIPDAKLPESGIRPSDPHSAISHGFIARNFDYSQPQRPEFREGSDRPREHFLPQHIKFNQSRTKFGNKWTYEVERRFVRKGQIEVLDMGTGCGNASQDVNAIIS